MHAPIKAMMNELVQNPPAAGPCDVTALSQRRWMIESETGPIVQLELMDDDVTALVYATTARDGSGPLRASFLTMLLLEDTVANSMLPYGICSGEATVTVYRKVVLHEATSALIYHEMMDFGQLATRCWQSLALVCRKSCATMIGTLSDWRKQTRHAPLHKLASGLG